ncbi:MAG TPA: DUF3419 family protein [Planctomycetota bacterium]|nr:DUF3419 family protein [Planctomycetota bacterium]
MIPEWARQAATWPLAFAQVREDAELDLEIASRLRPRASVVMVASGGCTAAALARHAHVARLQVVDPNPAQLAITRLKLRLLEEETVRRQELLGHAPMDPGRRETELKQIFDSLGYPADVLGTPDRVAGQGPDHAGRYERTFAAVRDELRGFHQELDELLSWSDAEKQSRRVASGTPFGYALDHAFQRAMSLEILVHLFGDGATGNRAREFCDHFAERTRNLLASRTAAGNPYLAQVMWGGFRQDHLTPWLSLPPGKPGAEVVEFRGSMEDALSTASGEFDFIHLSNILDWLDEASAARLLEWTWRALRPGGWVLVRQLNSTLDIRSLGGRIEWRSEDSARLHAADRSYFYSALHAGVRA